MPSSIHSDSLALPTLVPSTPLSLPTSPCQEPAIKEPVSSAPLSTLFQPNITFIPNTSRLVPVIVKAFKPDSNTTCPLFPAHVVLSRTHAADNSNGKSPDTDMAQPVSSRFRPAFVIIHSQVPAVAVVLTLLSLKSRKHCPWLVFTLQSHPMIIPKANQAASNCLACRSGPV